MIAGWGYRRGRQLLLGELRDRADITDLVHQLGACLDEHRFSELRALFADDVTATTPGGTAFGIEAVAAQAERNHAGYDRLHHLITNVLVDLDGDRAIVRANLLAVLVRAEAPDEAAALGSVYRFQLRRRAPQGWRFVEITVDPVWHRNAS